MTRKIISMFLCAALAAGSISVLASCSEKQDTGSKSTGTGGDGGSAKVPDDLNYSNLDEELRTINIAYVEGSNGTFTEHSLVVDELNIDVSDNVDLAVQRRNLEVQDQLGVTLYAEKVADAIGGLTGAVEQGIIGNNGDFDLLAGYQYYSIGMATKGYLYNLNDLATVEADFIDLDASYWGGAYNEALSYNDAYYWITGDIALRYMGGMYCTFVNADIYDQNLANEYGSIYDIAKEGKWTLDKLAEMASKVAVDDGDNIRNDTDTYGFGYELTDVLDGVAFASNVQFSEKQEDGSIKLVIDSNHTTDFANKLYEKITGGASAYSYNYGNNDSQTVMPKFAEGKVAFTVNKIFQSQVYLNEVENFYLIPAPKFDEAQENYVTGIHDGVTIFGIPIDCKKVPQTAATLELLAVGSQKYVMPAYYEQAMKTRYVRNEDGSGSASQMIDLIHDSVTTDFVAAWSESLSNIVHIFRTEAKLQKSSFVRNKTSWQKALDDLTANLTAAADNSTI